MIRTLLVADPKLAKALEIQLNLEKVQTDHRFEVFKKGGWIVILGDDMLQMRDIAEADYSPDSLFVCHLGRSIDTEHEIGDIILPNVFFECDESVCKKEITEENRDTFIKNPKFLEIFDEQKDYYVEDFGLSVGGIAVSLAPDASETNEALMMVYAGDVYFEKDISHSITLAQDTEKPALFIAGIVNGKKPDTLKEPYARLASNLMTTIKLLLQEEKN